MTGIWIKGSCNISQLHRLLPILASHSTSSNVWARFAVINLVFSRSFVVVQLLSLCIVLSNFPGVDEHKTHRSHFTGFQRLPLSDTVRRYCL